MFHGRRFHGSGMGIAVYGNSLCQICSEKGCALGVYTLQSSLIQSAAIIAGSSRPAVLLLPLPRVSERYPNVTLPDCHCHLSEILFRIQLPVDAQESENP